MGKQSKCVFNKKWTVEDRFSWVRAHTNKHNAYCSVCSKVIDLSDMGRYALQSHMKSKKHVNLASLVREPANINIKDFILKKEKDDVNANTNSNIELLNIPGPPAIATVLPIGLPVVKPLVIKDVVMKAEIIHTLHLITSHHSYKSSEISKDMYRSMFPDSEIAKQFSCGERKCAYIAVFGIGQYLIDKLKCDVRNSGPFVLLFDESLNKKMQKKQLDIHLRYWKDNRVETRYFSSEFIGRYMFIIGKLIKKILYIILQSFGLLSIIDFIDWVLRCKNY